MSVIHLDFPIRSLKDAAARVVPPGGCGQFQSVSSAWGGVGVGAGV